MEFPVPIYQINMNYEIIKIYHYNDYYLANEPLRSLMTNVNVDPNFQK